MMIMEGNIVICVFIEVDIDEDNIVRFEVFLRRR
jgi:hypothetical protein